MENTMASETLEARARELLGQLNPGKLAAVVHLLEVMIDEDEEELTGKDRSAISTSREYFRQGGQGLSFDQVVADCGFSMDQIRGTQKHS